MRRVRGVFEGDSKVELTERLDGDGCNGLPQALLADEVVERISSLVSYGNIIPT